MTALGRHGFVQQESSVGKPFDPTMHEAVAQIESSEYPAGTVSVEHRKGWKLYDRVVRPATVSVVKEV
jgi:molecular chaperone GrpE